MLAVWEGVLIVGKEGERECVCVCVNELGEGGMGKRKVGKGRL